MGNRSKKDEGFLYRLLPVLLSLGVVALLVVLAAGFLQAIRERDFVDQLAREYLLIMETEGYLSAGRQEELTASLTQAGLGGISLDGTTVTEVSYGDRITLSISGTLPQTILGRSNLSWDLPVSIHLSSTAKQ
ncbi:MAG: hypothetical protein LUG61_04545 [Lachnospiraceae bacterium]|nr:hypothetical protein [Lachnospiraceae bacterium]